MKFIYSVALGRPSSSYKRLQGETRNWLMVILDKLSVGIMVKFALDAELSLVPFYA